MKPVSMSSLPPSLIVKNIAKSFGEKIILQDISFEVGAQEIIVLMGRNGAGKTTLLRIIAGLLAPNNGQASLEPNKAIQRTGFLFQDFINSLFPWLSVAENISFALRLGGLDKKKRAGKVRELLAEAGIALPLERYPYQLSIGQQHLVAFLRIVLAESQVYLLDEPFSALDMFTKRGVMREFLTIWRLRKRPTIIVTHDLEEASLLGGRVLLLGDSPSRLVDEFEVSSKGRDAHPSSARLLDVRKKIAFALEAL